MTLKLVASSVALAMLASGCAGGGAVETERTVPVELPATTSASATVVSQAGDVTSSTGASLGDPGVPTLEELRGRVVIRSVEAAEPTTSTTNQTNPSTTNSRTTPTGSLSPPAGIQEGKVPAEVITGLLEYAASLWNVPVTDVSVERSSPWSWSDTSFGCAEFGKVYSQVITEGYWVVLSAHGQTLDLRVAPSGSFIDCRLPDERTP